MSAMSNSIHVAENDADLRQVYILSPSPTKEELTKITRHWTQNERAQARINSQQFVSQERKGFGRKTEGQRLSPQTQDNM